jgi:hypothetical protein
MKRFISELFCSLGVTESSNSIASTKEASMRPDDAKIYHDIYITLKDKSDKAVQKQLELGKKYLAHHKGELSFSATVLAHNLERHQQVPYLVNEEDFDVAFHMVFAGKWAHDLYQDSPAHVNDFIPKSKGNWVKIRVFDSADANSPFKVLAQN